MFDCSYSIRFIVSFLSRCTLDDSLVSDFSFVNGSGNEVFSTIYAFRFYSSPYVTFECKVRVCPENETDCQIVSKPSPFPNTSSQPITALYAGNRFKSSRLNFIATPPYFLPFCKWGLICIEKGAKEKNGRNASLKLYQFTLRSTLYNPMCY